MMWTKDVPTVPGWYWFRRVVGEGPIVIQVYDDETLLVTWLGPVSEFDTDALWCGPLPVPTEAT